MKHYVALLRGINVGGKNILPMRELIESLEKLGCQNVRTYIQSGNVVFQIDKAAAKSIGEKLGSRISKSHGFTPTVLIIEAAKFLQAIADCPYECESGNQLHFSFLESKPKSPDLESLTELKTSTERFQLGKGVFYLLAPDGIGRSKLAAKVERCLGVPITGRNWNTIVKIQSMLEQSS